MGKLDKKPENDYLINFGFHEIIFETILGFMFWSLFEGLPSMIWFYPLNELELSGYEAFAIVGLSPLLHGIPGLGVLLRQWWMIAIFRLASVACLGSFQAPSTLMRLIILAAGVACNLLVLTATLWHPSPAQRTITCWGLILGKFAMLSGRIWYTSFVPTWWDNYANTAIMTLAGLAALDKIVSGHDRLPALELKPKIEASGIISGIGLGSLIYVTYAIFGEVSLITRWTVKGFPDTGPMPWPWGAAVLIALWFGTVLSPCQHVAVHPLWWLIGCKAFTALYLLTTWMSFTGGLVLAVYIMSIWPAMLDRAAAGPPARTFAIACVVAMAEVLFSVWTVAYNFVPGGEYTREHTGYLIAFIMISIGAALLLPKRRDGQKSQTAFVESITGKMPNRMTSMILFLIVAGGMAGFLNRVSKQSISHPDIKQPNAVFSAAIWTYHFGYDNKGWPSLNRSAQLLRDTGADVITLLESDASKPFLGNNDLGMWLGEHLGMYVDFGVSTRDHTWGNLILSKYPIVKSKPLLLPSPHGELAPGVAATINMTGHLVDFVVTHMGNDRDVLDRKQQAEVLAQELHHAENPVVFLGYVTSAPFSRDYKKLVNDGRVKDIDNTDRDRWCEYIFYRGLQRLGYARISHGGLSDTEVQIAKFKIPQNLEDFQDNDKIVTDSSQIDKGVHFNGRFGSYSRGHNWVEKHKYHMNTPKYFVP